MHFLVMRCLPDQFYHDIHYRFFPFLVQKVVNGESTKYTLKTYFISGRVSASTEASSQIRRLDPREMKASTFKGGNLFNSIDITALDNSRSDIVKLTSNMSPQDEEQVSNVIRH